MDQKPVSERLRELSQFLIRHEKPAAGEPRFILSPYRICPLGAHVDHQGGPVLGMTINLYTLLAFQPIDEPVVRLHALNYGECVELTLQENHKAASGHWSSYMVGAIGALRRHYPLKRGIIGAVQGDLPGGGLSSSASVGLAYLMALAHANRLDISREELVTLDQILENEFLGLQNGILDQTTILFSRRDRLLYIDTLNFRTELLAPGARRQDFSILIAFSGISRMLTGTGFNQRVQECRQAAAQLARLARRDPVSRLGLLPDSVFEAYGSRLPDPLRRRAAHFFGERRRVFQGRAAWMEGDLTAFGNLMNASCRSSISNYESGSETLKRLWEITAGTAGVLGSRFSGGGYGGCVIALVETNRREEAVRRIEAAYLHEFPDLRGKAAFFYVEPEDGVRLL